MTKIVTKAMFAVRMGVTKARVSQYLQMGLPVRPDGRLDYERARTWVGANVARTDEGVVRTGGVRSAPAGGDLNAERLRLTRAKAEREELELARRRGELIPADEIVPGLEACVAHARGLLLGLPPSVSGEVVALVRREPDDAKAEGVVRELLADKVHDALLELSRTDIDQLLAAGSIDDDAADAA